MKPRIAEIFWVVGGQLATAAGTLVGVRVLTQFLQPATYGIVSLSLGMSVLAISVVSTPLTQAAIHYYPGVVADGSAHDLLMSLLRCFRRMGPWLVSGALLGGGVYVGWYHGSATLVVLLAVLLASDCWRSANLSLLNAAREHRRYALWLAADAWSRPLAATVAVLVAGQSPIAVLAAYVCVSISLLIGFSRRLWSDGASRSGDSTDRSRALDPGMWRYALPLIPLGVIGWASNLGDRYIIGGLLGVADAGVYAAVYGLASMPFMLVGGTAEQALRPVYQVAVSKGDSMRANRVLTIWLLCVASVCAVGVLAFSFGNGLIASLFVGRPYRHASALMPWIGAGYAIRSVSYVFERVCYAYGRTDRVLVTQFCAVVATAIATPLGIVSLGIKGAAIAVPVYFTVQLAVALYLALQTIRDAGRQANSPVPPNAVATGT